jgi:DNA helicase-2/ATP-dependent DNA helicase PcrA
MSQKNRLFIAAAGAGKTTLIVNEALANNEGRILITTFTIANAQSIRERLVKENGGVIPVNVTVQTWCSFLLEHGIRPYRFGDMRDNGMFQVNSRSGIRYTMNNGTPVYWGEADFDKCFFNSENQVYSDKLARLVFLCNNKSDGCVINRIEKIFTHIDVDEVQDMVGLDLELFKLLIKSSVNFTMVGDPRQALYSTHPDKKYEKYANGKIKEFVSTECKAIGYLFVIMQIICYN